MRQLGIGYAAADRDAISIVPCSDIESLEREQTLDPAKCYKYTGTSQGRWVKGALYNALQWHVTRDFCDVCGRSYPDYHTASCGCASADSWVCPECKYEIATEDNTDTAPKHARRCSMSDLHSLHITYTTADPKNLAGWYALVDGPAYGEGATYKKLQQEGSDDRNWQPYTDNNARTIVGTSSGYEVQDQNGQSIASWSTLHGTDTVSDGTTTGTITREHVGGCSIGDGYPAQIVVTTPDTYTLISNSADYAGTYTRTQATRPTSTDGEYAPVYTNGSKYIYFALNKVLTDSGSYESIDALTLASTQFSAAFARGEWGIYRTTTTQPEADRETAAANSDSNLVVDARCKSWGSSNIQPTGDWFASSKYQEYFWASAYKVSIKKADPVCAALTQTQYRQIEKLEGGPFPLYPGITYEASISSASTLSPAILALTTSAWWVGPTTVSVDGYDTSPITATCRLCITVGQNASVTLNGEELMELVAGYRYECEVSWNGSTMNTILKVLSKISTGTTL